MVLQVGNIRGPQGATLMPPPGGTTGQVLNKLSNTDYDVTWNSALTVSPTNATLAGDLLFAPDATRDIGVGTQRPRGINLQQSVAASGGVRFSTADFATTGNGPEYRDRRLYVDFDPFEWVYGVYLAHGGGHATPDWGRNSLHILGGADRGSMLVLHSTATQSSDAYNGLAVFADPTLINFWAGGTVQEFRFSLDNGVDRLIVGRDSIRVFRQVLLTKDPTSPGSSLLEANMVPGGSGGSFDVTVHPDASVIRANLAATGTGTMNSGATLRVGGGLFGLGASITTLTGVRIENQGAAAVTHAYGVFIENQAGAATTNVGLRNDGSSILTQPVLLSRDPTANMEAATKQYVDAAGLDWPLLAPDGTAAAPSYSFSDSPGTGMSFVPDGQGNPDWDWLDLQETLRLSVAARPVLDLLHYVDWGEEGTELRSLEHAVLEGGAAVGEQDWPGPELGTSLAVRTPRIRPGWNASATGINVFVQAADPPTRAVAGISVNITGGATAPNTVGIRISNVIGGNPWGLVNGVGTLLQDHLACVDQDIWTAANTFRRNSVINIGGGQGTSISVRPAARLVGAEQYGIYGAARFSHFTDVAAATPGSVRAVVFHAAPVAIQSTALIPIAEVSGFRAATPFSSTPTVHFFQTAYGLYVENQGGVGRVNAYGVFIENQTGASTASVGLHNAGSSYLTQPVTLSRDPIEAMEAATKQYVDANGVDRALRAYIQSIMAVIDPSGPPPPPP
jgi:hypothetical protein